MKSLATIELPMFFPSSPITKDEEFLILRLRSYSNALYEITTQDSKPYLGRIFVSDMANRQMVKLHQPTQEEFGLLSTLRRIPFGKVVVVVKDGVPFVSPTMSYKSEKLGEMPGDIEIEG